jgi:predicted phage terminase large subunit-like protein
MRNEVGAVVQLREGRAETLRRVRAERARRSFQYFVGLIRPQFALQWFHAWMCEELDAAGTSSSDSRLGLALPPGHAKSEYAILYCAWMVARDRDITIKYVTYSQTFAEDQFSRLKEVLALDVFTEHFGAALYPRGVRGEGSGKNTESKIELVGGSGWLQACGFGGGITGGRCDVIVIDDPFKNWEEAQSPTIREKRWREYGASIKSRRRPGRPLRILMLFTRWHLDDLAGRCQKIEADEWRWIELAALRDDEPGEGDVDPREVGEALWPAVLTREQAEKEREQRPVIFMALYQQKPVPDGGALFKLAWFAERWTVLPGGPGAWVQSWDFRHGGKSERSSFVVGQLWWFPDGEARAYLVDLVRGQWGPDESLLQFDAAQRRPMWSRSSQIFIEEKADGVTVISMRRRTVRGIIPVSPRGDKFTRARAVAPFARAGNIVLPAEALWLGEFLAELCTFPGAVTDDQVDATSQAISQVWLGEALREDSPLERLRRRRRNL